MKAIIRKDEQAVSPVIATILMVAITVVLAAVLYVMVSGLLVGPGASKPVLTFGTPTTSSGSTTVTIASVSQSVGRDNYRVNLRVNTTTGSAVALAAAGAASSLSVGGATYTIPWAGIGGGGARDGRGPSAGTRGAHADGGRRGPPRGGGGGREPLRRRDHVHDHVDGHRRRGDRERR